MWSGWVLSWLWFASWSGTIPLSSSGGSDWLIQSDYCLCFRVFSFGLGVWRGVPWFPRWLQIKDSYLILAFFQVKETYWLAKSGFRPGFSFLYMPASMSRCGCVHGDVRRQLCGVRSLLLPPLPWLLGIRLPHIYDKCFYPMSCFASAHPNCSYYLIGLSEYLSFFF